MGGVTLREGERREVNLICHVAIKQVDEGY